MTTQIHTSRTDRHAPLAFALILSALVAVFVLLAARELAAVVAQVTAALGGAA